ncbi:MAG TPA: flavoprotein, partial [Burkholderiaceae bacterium]|nr:flavoprotein [Burkholderiaceae bacterium]
MELAERKIVLGVTGGIAAYKSCELVRRLREQGARVQAVMTASAHHFLAPASLQALTGMPVLEELWD